MKLPFLGKKEKPEENKNAGGGAGSTNNTPPPPGDAQVQEKKNPAQVLAQGMMSVKDIIAPSALEVDFNHIRIGNNYYRTLFVSGYPRFVGANWLSPIINFDHSLDISMFYYPVKARGVLDDLRRKMTEMEATVMSNQEKGRLQDPAVVAALEDARDLQEQLVKGVEKFFQFSFYITISAESLQELETVTTKLESTLGSLLLISKTATLQMEEAFQTTIPTAFDKLLITRNMDTTSLATTFPFTSSDLTSDDGILYGINRHNGSLVIFDRFTMENANTVVFAKSGAGKSYAVKLEALRSLVFGSEIIIIDVEEEYRPLCEAVGGDFISFSPNSPAKINPFDLSGIAVEGENELGQKIFSLYSLFKLMLGDLNGTEEAILDKALLETYRIKGITTDPETQRTKEPPVMEDLYKVLLGSDEPEAKGMADRLEKYIRGSMTGIFDSQSTINIDNRMTVFSTKNLEDILRPIAFYIILDFIWTKIKKDLKKRILIVEEAWYLLQNEDSARFIYGIAKRARKYYLGLTTISQDVDEFLQSEFGKAIVTNSSIILLLKQHPAAIDLVAETFYLSEGEKRLLLAADKGEGLFFAGSSHIAIKVVASEAEHKLVTTNPAELLKLKEEQEAMGSGNLQETKPQYKPLDRLVNTSPVKPETPEAQETPETQEQRPIEQPPEQRPEQPSGQSFGQPPAQEASEIVRQPPRVVKQPLDEVEESGPSENEEEPREVPGVKEDRNKMEEQMRGPSKPVYLDAQNQGQNQGNESEGQGGNQNNNQPERRDGTFTIGNRPLQGDIPTSDNQNQ
jgi:conjugal transfer ATP-binding protein TraC